MAARGVKKVVDFQDIAYGGEYLDRLESGCRARPRGEGYALSNAAAKYLANAMSYDDVIRVADLKTRSPRGARVRREIGVTEDSVLRVTEYFHPRIEEFCGTMPVRLGRFIEQRPKLAAFLDRRVNRGRHIRTDSMTGFAMLWLVGGLRRWRRRLCATRSRPADRSWYRLALICRRGLCAGGRDPRLPAPDKRLQRHACAAQSKYDRVLSALELLKGRADAADWIRRLREAALKDEKGEMLDGALKTVRSLE